MDGFLRDLRYALRTLARAPGFTLTVVLTLALGIGATTAMFTIYEQILLRPLPVPEAERLVNLGAPGPKPGMNSCGLAGPCELVFSYPMFRDLEAQQDVFEGIAAHNPFDANLSNGSRTSSGTGLLVSGGYFDVLELRPALGRLIESRDEPQLGESAVAVLSYGFWEQYFGADPSVVGQSLVVNGHALEVIGVTPRGFTGTTLGQRVDVFVPLTLGAQMQPTRPETDTDRRAYWLYLFARLRDGMTGEQAAAQINGLYRGILNEVEAPLNTMLPADVLERFREREITVEPGALGQSDARANGRRALTLLLGVTLFVLLIACVNIANLLLARGATRASEVAIRASIGAQRSQLVSQLLTETAFLALLGGIASLPVAGATLSAIMSIFPAQAAANVAIELDARAVVFAAGASLATLLVFGLAPALHASRLDPGLVVKGQPGRASGGRGLLRFRRGLVTAQIGLSLMLLVGAGLFAQSLVNVAREDLGMRIDSVVTFSVSPRLNGYSSERVMEIYRDLEERLASEPGVTAVATSMVPLLTDSNWGTSMRVEGFESQPGDDATASTNAVSPGFFETLAIPLLAGRDFLPSDAGDAPRVAIVNESFARKFNLGDRVVGKRIAVGQRAEALDIEIVGLVADAKYSTVKGEIPPLYFLPRLQDDNLGTLSFYVRSALDPDTTMARIFPIVASVDANLPVVNLMTVEQVVADNVFLDRMITTLSAAFALLATLLAAVGLYGVLAYNVAQRTRELGLRQALGATAGNVRSLVLIQVVRMALVGITIGLVGAALLGGVAEALLFGLSAFAPLVFIAATLLLAAVVLLASFVPAQRAASIAPMEALRYE